MWNRWFVLVIQWIFTSCSLESTNAWNNSQLPTHIMRYRIGGIDTSSRVLFQDPFKMHDPWILSASISPKVESDAIKARATIRIRQDKVNVNPSTSYETKKNDVVSRRNIKGSSSSSKIPASLDIEFLIKRTDQIVAKHDRFASNSSIHILRSVHWLMDAWIQMNGNTDIHRNRNAFSMNSKSLQGRLENYFPDSPSTFVTYQVQRLFDALQEQYNIQPTDKTWTRIIKAHGQERGGEYAMKIVHQMPISQRNVHYYAEVLDSFASEIMMKRSPRRGGDGGILPVSVSPDDSLAKVAQDILQKMIVDDNLPIPNARCFHAVIRAWGHECNPPAAQATLSLMQTLYSQGRIEEAPNRFCFNAIIYAWTNTGYEWHAEMAEELIHEMIQSDTVHPNIVSYNLCISAWAKVGNGERAEGILRKMNTLALKDASFQPSTLTYNTVMNAYSKSPDADAAEKAEKILFEMKKRADKEGIDYQVRPDFFSYSTCINAWARSLDSQKLDRVLNIYEELIQDVNIRPNGMFLHKILLQNHNDFFWMVELWYLTFCFYICLFF